VRWEELFADLSAQGAAGEAAEQAAEVADRGRWEAGRLGIAERLQGWAIERRLIIGLPGADRVTGSLLAVGHDWVALHDGTHECVVPLVAVRWIKFAGPVLTESPGGGSGREPLPGSSVRGRLGLVHAVRYLARDRAYLRIGLVDGETVCGTPDRAGLDHLELAQHPADVPRRASSVQATWIVPYAAIATIRGGQVWSAP
jgi:hypothetical protein